MRRATSNLSRRTTPTAHASRTFVGHAARACFATRRPVPDASECTQNTARKAGITNPDDDPAIPKAPDRLRRRHRMRGHAFAHTASPQVATSDKSPERQSEPSPLYGLCAVALLGGGMIAGESVGLDAGFGLMGIGTCALVGSVGAACGGVSLECLARGDAYEALGYGATSAFCIGALSLFAQ